MVLYHGSNQEVAAPRVVDALQTCRTLDFSLADGRWLDFVAANRNGTYEGQPYDFVHGPIANDDVYRTLLFYFEGLMTREVALEALKVRKLYNQYVFKSARALEAENRSNGQRRLHEQGGNVRNLLP